jgi:hypothetical protein
MVGYICKIWKIYKTHTHTHAFMHELYLCSVFHVNLLQMLFWSFLHCKAEYDINHRYNYVKDFVKVGIKFCKVQRVVPKTIHLWYLTEHTGLSFCKVRQILICGLVLFYKYNENLNSHIATVSAFSWIVNVHIIINIVTLDLKMWYAG